MIAIGEQQTLVVRNEKEQGLYLGGEERKDQVLLPRKYVPPGTQLGDSLRVFVYTDSEDRPVATTQTPKAAVGDFALLEVVDVTPHGAFLDWGLDKDLFAPKKEQSRRLRVGDRCVFAVTLDPRDERVKASSLLGKYLDYDVSHLKPGAEVDLLVYDERDIGYLVVVDDAHSGLVYRNEVFEPLEIGQRLIGWIKTVRSDNKIDVRIQRPGASGIDDAQEVVLEALRKAGGFLPLHDKSPPAEIYEALGMSKKAFKRALGGLYKARRVELGPEGTKLL